MAPPPSPLCTNHWGPSLSLLTDSFFFPSILIIQKLNVIINKMIKNEWKTINILINHNSNQKSTIDSNNEQLAEGERAKTP